MLYRDGRLVTTAGVAVVDGCYFLAKRKPGGALSHKWEFPGGKCDQDDGTERNCLIREFEEEFRVAVTVGDEIGTVPFEHKGTRYLLVAYQIRFHSPPDILLEHTDSGWFPPEELCGLDLAESDRRLIEDVILV
ncbi:MAG: NUDIX domain-containing protein [Alkalispirochaeta sp.]